MALDERFYELEGENYGVFSEKTLQNDQYSESVSLEELHRQYAVLGEVLEEKGLWHPDAAVVYNSIGRLYMRLGEYARAHGCYEQAMHVRQRAFGPDSIETAACYHFIAGACFMQHNYDKALYWLEKELEISERVLGAAHPDTEVSYQYINMVKVRAGIR